MSRLCAAFLDDRWRKQLFSVYLFSIVSVINVPFAAIAGALGLEKSRPARVFSTPPGISRSGGRPSPPFLIRRRPHVRDGESAALRGLSFSRD